MRKAIIFTTCLLGLLCLGARSAPSLSEAYLSRSHRLLQTYQSGLFANRNVKELSYDTLAYVAYRGCGPAKMSDDMVDTLRPDLIAQNGDKAALNFVLPPLTRYLLQFGRCLTPAQTQTLKDRLALPQPLFDHGTENHAIMAASSYYLLTQRFPEMKWTDAKGQPHTSTEVQARYRDLLLARFRKYMADGFNEQLSPTYGPIDLFPLLNLVDFADDAGVRSAAETMATAEIGLMRADSVDGALLPPLMRENVPGQETSNPTSIARDVLWLYYGGFGPIDQLRPEPPYGAMLAASSWRPPDSLLALRQGGDTPQEVKVVTPNFAIWDAPTHPEAVGGARIERDFAIGAGNIFPDPSGENAHTVAFRIVIRGLQPVGAIDCYQPYWHGDEGEDAWDTDRSSPFQHSWRSGRQGVLLYDIPQQDPYTYPASNRFFAWRAQTAAHLHQVAVCRLPRAADTLDVTPKGVFARYGRVFVALLSIGEAPAAVDRQPVAPKLKEYISLKVRGPRIGLYYRAEPAARGEALGAFERRIGASAPVYDERTQTASLTDEGGRVQVHPRPVMQIEPHRTPGREDNLAGVQFGPTGVVAESAVFDWRDGRTNERP